MYVTGLQLTSESVAGIGVRTTVARQKGDFIGFYSGEIISCDEYVCRILRDRSTERLGFEVTGTDSIILRHSLHDLIGYVNEPPPGQTANVVAIPLHLDAGNAIGYYVGSLIEANTELLVHYGDDAARDYPVGNAIRAPARLQITNEALSPDACMLNSSQYCVPRRVYARHVHVRQGAAAA